MKIDSGILKQSRGTMEVKDLIKVNLHESAALTSNSEVLKKIFLLHFKQTRFILSKI